MCESFNLTIALDFRKATSVSKESSAKTKTTRKPASSEDVGKLNVLIIIVNLLLTKILIKFLWTVQGNCCSEEQAQSCS